jgi:hypothetical protein
MRRLRLPLQMRYKAESPRRKSFRRMEIKQKPGNSESQGGGGLKLFPGAIGAMCVPSGCRRGSGSASFHAGGPARIVVAAWAAPQSTRVCFAQGDALGVD